MQALADCAWRHGRSLDLADFAARVDPRQLNRMQLENLIRAGAFDALEAEPRAAVTPLAEAILRRAQATAAEKESGQIALFGASSRCIARNRCACPRCRTGRRWNASTLRPRRSASISPRIRSMPMRKALRRLGTTPCAQVEAGAQSGITRVRLAGTVAAQKERVTRTGNRMAWVRDHRCVGLLRSHAVRRGSGARARPACQWLERAGHRRPAAGWRGAARHRPGRGRRSIRPPPAPARRCASGCVRRHQCRISAICWGARGRAKGA